MPNLSIVQNKSVYTRRFNILKNQIRKIYSEDVMIDDTVAVRFGPESCIIAHDGDYGFTLHFYNELGDFQQSVQIVKSCGRFYTGLIGIHCHDTDLNHLQDMIESALKDGFESIYVHSIDSVSRKAV
jgi:hypothetical protein